MENINLIEKIKLTTQQIEELSNIIITSKSITKDVLQYLKDHNLQHTWGRNYVKKYGTFTKVLIHEIIETQNLNEQHTINRYHNNIPLTQEEFDVIVGGLLGDTWIGYYKKSKNPSGSFTHKMEHLDYVQYKYSFLKRRCSELKIHNKYDKRSNRHYQQCFCKIRATPVLKEIQEKFYINGRKTVPKDLIYQLSPLGIAIWFMDDGASDSGGYKFSVDCFNEQEINDLQEMLATKFHIYTTKNINQNKIIHVLSTSKYDFKKLIEPYICDCMKYKLQIYKTINGKVQRVDI